MVRFQLDRLRPLLRHTVQKVRFYRDLYRRHGVNVDDVRSLDDLRRLPLVSKQDLGQAAPADLVAAGLDPGRLVTHRTSGSTGVPTTVYRSRFEETLLSGFRWRSRLYHGARPGDRIVKLSIGLDTMVWPHRLMSAVKLFGTHGLNSLAPPAEIVERLTDLRPDVIIGYPSVLAAVAARVKPRHRRRLKPHLILPGAETLSAEQRRTIAGGFQANVFESYGSYEFYSIGWQCRQDSCLHTCDDNVIVEILNQDGRPVGEGESGEVVCTALHAYAAPLIRFRHGDMAVRGSARCTCGAPYGTLRDVIGRITDYFILPSGREIHPYALFKPLLHHAGPWIRKYQLLQTQTDKVVLKLVPRQPGASFPTAALKAEGERILEPGVDFEIKLVNDIPPLPSGKFPNFRSLVGGENRKTNY